MIAVNLDSDDVQERGTAQLDTYAHEAREVTALARTGKGTGQTLYQALDAFAVWIRETKLTPEGRVEVRVPDDFPFASKGLPAGYQPVSKFHAMP